MTAEWRDLNFHERKERQSGQDIVQILCAGHVEYADVGVVPRHSPQMTPDTCALQILCTRTFRLLQRVGPFGRHIVWNPHIHFDMKQHGYEPVVRLANM
jgi:hypothetical protein